MRNKKVLLTSTLIFIICITCIFNVFAHKGRTDSNGGHRDNNNQSGLGGYHYHCGGYPAHLHNNGVCPYTSSNKNSYSNSSSEASDFLKGKAEERAKEVDGYYEGYNEGYDKGYDDGYKARTEEASAERKKEAKILMISLLVIVIFALLIKFLNRNRQE